LGMILAVDVSASSTFGSVRRSKREFATEIASTLAFSAARNSDKVGLLLFTDKTELYLPPRKGRRHILRLIREMVACEPKHPGTNISAALAFLNHVLHRRSIVFLITDFLHSLQPDANQLVSRRDLTREIGFTNLRHDLVCVHLHDPRESELPAAGLLTLADAETGELVEVDSARVTVRQTYAETNAQRLAELDRALRRGGVDTLRFSTAEPFAQKLQYFFETRRRR